VCVRFLTGGSPPVCVVCFSGVEHCPWSSPFRQFPLQMPVVLGSLLSVLCVPSILVLHKDPLFRTSRVPLRRSRLYDPCNTLLSARSAREAQLRIKGWLLADSRLRCDALWLGVKPHHALHRMVWDMVCLAAIHAMSVGRNAAVVSWGCRVWTCNNSSSSLVGTQLGQFRTGWKLRTWWRRLLRRWLGLGSGVCWLTLLRQRFCIGERATAYSRPSRSWRGRLCYCVGMVCVWSGLLLQVLSVVSLACVLSSAACMSPVCVRQLAALLVARPTVK
jgi:hypothetical protein